MTLGLCTPLLSVCMYALFIELRVCVCVCVCVCACVCLADITFHENGTHTSNCSSSSNSMHTQERGNGNALGHGFSYRCNVPTVVLRESHVPSAGKYASKLIKSGTPFITQSAGQHHSTTLQLSLTHNAKLRYCISLSSPVTQKHDKTARPCHFWSRVDMTKNKTLSYECKSRPHTCGLRTAF